MAKKIELIIEIDSSGKIIVTPSGTEGAECLEIMAFLDKIASFNVLETTPNEDMKKINRQKNNLKNTNQS